MWIAILSSLICLTIAVILFTPMFRNAPLFRPVSLFFIFMGVWVLANYLVTQVWPGSAAMQWILYTGIIVFGGYLLMCLFFSRPKKEKQPKKNRKVRGANAKRV